MRFERRLKPQVTVDLVPLIDVVFQLVIFFMVSTTFLVTPGIGLIFPKAATAEPVAMTKIVITVASRDEIYLNKEEHTIKSLDDRLAEIKAQDREAEEEVKRTIILEGDKDISYSLLVEVLDVLRQNGFQGVNLRTREIQELQEE
jgi:biopolymer transport protein ExbD